MTKNFTFIMHLGGVGNTAEEAWKDCDEAVAVDGLGDMPKKHYLEEFEHDDEVDFAHLEVRLGVAETGASIGDAGHWWIYTCEVSIAMPFVSELVEELAQQQFAKDHPDKETGTARQIHAFWLDGYNYLETTIEEKSDANQSQ